MKGEPRRTAISRFVSGAGALAPITFPDRPYGHILATGPVHADTWPAFMRASLDRAIALNGATIAAEAGDPASLRGAALAFSDGLPERPAKTLVHGDYFAGNVLIDDGLEDPRPAAFYRAFAAFTMADPQYGLPPYPRLYPWAIATLQQLARGELA